VRCAAMGWWLFFLRPISLFPIRLLSDDADLDLEC
jgi:hypothetical protein